MIDVCRYSIVQSGQNKQEEAMRISIDLSKDEANALSEAAQRLGVSLEELAHMTIADVLNHPGMSFEDAKEHVLRKNEELFRRLA